MTDTGFELAVFLEFANVVLRAAQFFCDVVAGEAHVLDEPF